MTIKKPYCKKRNEILPISKNMPEDYCVDCEYFDNGDCFAADLPTKCVGGHYSYCQADCQNFEI